MPGAAMLLDLGKIDEALKRWSARGPEPPYVGR
jgi:hypothetical protein